jgi:hypothetical protein
MIRQIVFFGVFLLFAFFLMSRKSNLVPDSVHSFDDKKQLTRGKVFINKGVAIVAFEWTKTIQSGERRLKIPLVNIPGSVLCPVNEYTRMCRVIPAPDDSPAFVLRKHYRLVHVTYPQCLSKLRYIINKTGRVSELYSSHSFRRSGATFAFRSHIPSKLIQSHGDWASDAYKVYLEFSFADNISVARDMANYI